MFMLIFSNNLNKHCRISTEVVPIYDVMENNQNEIISSSEETVDSENETEQLTYQTAYSQTFNDTYIQFYGGFQKYSPISIAVAVIAIIVVITMSANECTKCFSKVEQLQSLHHKEGANLKKFWVYGRNVQSGYLHNVFLILDRLGYKNNPNATDWNLLWAHDYPFRTLQSQLKNLKPYQKVNKLPGSGYITNKVDLATSGLKYIPPAFRLPKDKVKLLEHAKDNPNAQFVQKNNRHRDIHIKRIEEIDLDVEGTFVQEFVDKPLLVSGYKFDIGIYVIVTSVDPLRIYIYNGDALLRFCPVKYNPFDPDNVDKYVIGDDYLPTWEVPALKHYYNVLGFGMKESLNAYVRSKGKDPAVIWDQIEDSITIAVLAKEQQIVNVVNSFTTQGNFFEMMRFDFAVTEDLAVFLMEANMSPNLSSAHFPPNQLLFEQVIFNLFGLIGVGERVKNTVGSKTETHMEVADKNIVVFPTECNSALCRSSCVSPICQLCRPCLSEEAKANLVQAYKEHINRGTCKRIFPPSMKPESIDIHEDLERFSPENQLQYRWFQGKCLLDSSWCT